MASAEITETPEVRPQTSTSGREAEQETERPTTREATREGTTSPAPFQRSVTSFLQTFLFFLLLLAGIALIVYIMVLGFDTRIAASSPGSVGAVLGPLGVMIRHPA